MTKAQIIRRIKHLLDRLSNNTRTTLVLGCGAALVGLVAVALAELADWTFSLFHRMTEYWSWRPLLSLPLGGMAIRWLPPGCKTCEPAIPTDLSTAAGWRWRCAV